MDKKVTDNMTNNVFIQLQPKHWQALYEIYKAHKEEPTIALQQMIEHLKVLGFSDKQSSAISSMVISNFKNIKDASEDELFIAQSDFKDLKTKLASETNGKIIKLVLALVAHSRTRNHPSGWIKYERKSIFYLAGVSKLKVADQVQLMSTIHQKYGFDMQVVGSNQPIPCYKMNWLQPATDGVGTDNALVDIGPTSPATITDLLYVLFPPEEFTVVKNKKK